MRWIWIDRFEAFETGRRAVARKCVSLAEDHLHDHFPDYPIMPASLLVEGMAQTAGILVGEARNFAEKVILAKVKRAEFFELVRPGDQVLFDASVEQLTEAAASTVGRITTAEGRLIGEVDIVFSHIDQNMSGLEFPDDNFVFTEQFMSLLRTFRPGGEARVAL